MHVSLALESFFLSCVQEAIKVDSQEEFVDFLLQRSLALIRLRFHYSLSLFIVFNGVVRNNEREEEEEEDRA
jgi:hypothetical protein